MALQAKEQLLNYKYYQVSERTLIERIAWDQILGPEGPPGNAFFIDMFFL